MESSYRAKVSEDIFGDAQSGRIKKVVAGFTALADLRNEAGDAHGHRTDAATAWLAVHWAGALIVYIVQRSETMGVWREPPRQPGAVQTGS